MKHIGFTGTQSGLTGHQQEALWETLYRLSGDVLHHGDCIGADAAAHEIAYGFGWEIHVHPPEIDIKRAHCRNVDYLHREKPYLERNHDIVNACEVLVAAPATATEKVRSGTWATVRYARQRGIPIKIIYPSGMVIEELAR